MEEDDEDLISEIFFRLNLGTPLSGGQKSISLVDLDTAKFVKSILNDKFFSQICKFSPLQRRKGDDLCTLMQTMLLLDYKNGLYDLDTISENDVMTYAGSIKRNYSEEQRELLFDVIDYLEKSFPEPEKNLKKINIPIAAVVAVRAMGDNYNSAKSTYRVGPMYFRKWFAEFFSERYDDYREYCSSGSIKKEKTLKRIEIMEASFVDYFELDNDDTEQETDSSSEDDDTVTQTGEDDLSGVCESNSDVETESTEDVEKPPEELSEETA